MIVWRAAWVCPISRAPVRDGWLSTRDGRIVQVAMPGQPPPAGAVTRDLGSAVVLPGLINAHTHLELAWLRGRVPPAATFIDWVEQLIAARSGWPEREDDGRVMTAARAAAHDMRAAGTVAVGDISNSLVCVGALREAGLSGIVFHELLGFDQADGSRVDTTRGLRAQAAAIAGPRLAVSVSPHAPYSVSAELFRAIRHEVNGSGVHVTSVHVAESSSEVELLADGSGPWPRALRRLGVFRDEWDPPRKTPVAYLDGLGLLDERTMVVHGVHLDDAALARLAAIGCTLVTCPRSNRWVGVGAPPVARFFASGVRVAVGTDSLASVDDLNIFEELREMRRLAGSVPAGDLLRSATLSGAEALDLAAELGSIEPGKRAALIAVDLQGPVGDVEERLVSGIDVGQMRWLEP
jgi:cytosine/adenosine deaminase-related metal-dependent hydrolase